MNKELIVKPIHGLTNRLKVIDSAYALGEAHKFDVSIIWKIDGELNAPFDKLFKINGEFKVKHQTKYRNRFIFPKNNPVRDTKNLAIVGFSRFLKGLKFDREIYYDDIFNVSQEIQSSNELIQYNDFDKLLIEKLEKDLSDINRYSKVFISSCHRFYPNSNKYHYLHPIDYLQNKIDSITSGFDNTIGLHIRRTDHKRARDYSTLEKFHEVIASEISKDKSVNFFLATDDFNVENELRAKYGKKIITYKKVFGRDSLEGMQDAVVELFCLSKTQKLYGSLFSTYSQVAANLSGIPEISVK